ncbi:MAG: hypothetical protein ACW981_21480 [Candidatus Hodarchaeales archaeon]|jgi:hypothetical protein
MLFFCPKCHKKYDYDDKECFGCNLPLVQLEREDTEYSFGIILISLLIIFSMVIDFFNLMFLLESIQFHLMIPVFSILLFKAVTIFGLFRNFSWGYWFAIILIFYYYILNFLDISLMFCCKEVMGLLDLVVFFISLLFPSVFALIFLVYLTWKSNLNK